jgi:competence protein ComEC
MRFIKFNIKIFASFFLFGICLAQFFYFYKNYLLLLLLTLFTLILFYKHYYKSNQFNQLLPYLLLILLTIAMGFGWICWHIGYFKQSDKLVSVLGGKPTLVQGTVIGLPFRANNALLFDFLINDKNKIRLKWFNTLDELTIGDRWQFYVKLKKPRNFATPGSFDVEKYMFIENIMAIGRVINSSDNLLTISYQERPFKINFFIDHLRQKIINKVNLAEKYWNLTKTGIILALGLGVKHSILPSDLLIFQNTGTAHLLAISGLHISVIVGLWFWFVSYLWKRFAPVQLLEKFPATIVAASISIIVATLYASLAGFGVATIRALIMTTLSLLAIIFRKITTVIQVYCVALIGILILDPFASLSSGFWLSFLAVGILLYKKPANLITTNWVMLIGLLPISGLYFGKISFVAIISNLVAVPWVNFLILPWILIGLLLYGVFNIDLAIQSLVFADLNLQLLTLLLNKLQNIPYAVINIATPTLPVVIISFIGSLWLLAPKGLLNRSLAIICFLPLFFNKKLLPEYGNLMVSVLDVGQGLSVVIKLKNHILLYDTGANNKVVANYLKNFNHNVIEQAIISHTDVDHIGGLEDLLKQKNTIKNFVTNVDYKIFNLTASLCRANQSWELDGVNFEFLHPNNSENLISKNDNSCVLKISTAKHSMLLTGDISKTAEKVLVENNYNKLKADVLLIPHHGSKYSSSLSFIKAVAPKYAVVSAGYINRYGHPKPKILARYSANNIKVLNTIEHGTVDFAFNSETILYNCYRITNRNFWNY